MVERVPCEQHTFSLACKWRLRRFAKTGLGQMKVKKKLLSHPVVGAHPSLEATVLSEDVVGGVVVLAHVHTIYKIVRAHDAEHTRRHGALYACALTITRRHAL